MGLDHVSRACKRKVQGINFWTLAPQRACVKRALWRRCHFHATNILQLLFAIRVQCKSNKGSELLVCYIELFNQNMQSQKFCRQRHGGFACEVRKEENQTIC